MLRRLALALPLLLSALPARAGEMEVMPVLVSLSREEKSVVVSIRNRSPEPARYQVSVFAWAQGTDGQMKLGPTEDVVAFPRVLTLAPNEAKILRVGAVTNFGTFERAYRLFVEEMPPPAKAGEPSRVRVLSRVGIPVFVLPAIPAVEKATLESLELQGGKATFALRNAGNVHVRPFSVRLVVEGEKEKVIAEKALDAWYVLAGDERRYEVQLPEDRCADVRHVEVEVKLPKAVLRDHVDVPRGTCAR
jgi:fimbrial chaperone protein